jgi:putative ABC transport system permease protein
MTARLLRAIWRFYPGAWRERFLDEAEADLRVVGPRPRHIVDALRMLPHVWLAELAARRAGRRPERERRELGADVRNAWRSVARAPRRLALVISILGLALGANAAVFSVGWAVLLRTLPYAEPDRIVRIEPAAFSLPDEGRYEQAPDFVGMPAIESAGLYIPGGGANLLGNGGADRLAVTQVDQGFFATLGVDALLGRVIGGGPADATEAVLSHALWTEAFGGDPSVIGRSLDLSGHAFTVVGVAPPDVDFPVGTELWVSLPAVGDFFGWAFTAEMIARLRTPEDLPAVLAARRTKLAVDWAEVPEDFARPEVAVRPLRDELVGPVRTPLVVLGAAAAAILLLGSFNLAGLEVARVHGRVRELAVRRALGAGTRRIVRQLALEVVLLAGAAGAASLGFMWLAERALVRLLPPELPGLEHAGLAPPVALFLALATAGAALAFGLLPVLRGARVVPSAAGRTSTADRHQARLQRALVVAQVAGAAVLGVGAALLGRSLGELRAVPLGYDTEAVLTFRVRLPSHAYPDGVSQRAYVDRVEARLRALPGIEAVGHSNRLPLASGIGTGLRLRAGRPGEGGPGLSTALVQVSDGFFDAMGIALLAGTLPVRSETPGQEVGDVVIDRSTAERLFGEGAPVGQPIVFVGRREIPGAVAGVVEDVRFHGHDGPHQNVVYASTEGAWIPSVAFVIRTRGEAAELAPAMRAALGEIDPSVPPFEVRTTGEAVAEHLAARRAVTGLSGLFGVAALALVALGLYGMVAQNVASRTREIGIRLAFGAPRGRVVRDTVGRAVLLVLAGAAIGLPAALVVTRLLRSLLLGVAPGDPVVLLGVLAVLLSVGAAVAFAAAARIVRIEPTEALRVE